jgi:flagellar biosynthesis/type III secretory pathway M-ring protein FliF/YscJ
MGSNLSISFMSAGLTSEVRNFDEEQEKHRIIIQKNIFTFIESFVFIFFVFIVLLLCCMAYNEPAAWRSGGVSIN